MGLEKILVRGLLIASLASCGGGGGGSSGPDLDPKKTNSPPVAALLVSPNSGDASLEVSIQLTCTDPDGASDIKEYKFSDGNGTDIIQSSPINTTINYNEEGVYSATGECVDNSSARSAVITKDVTVNSPPEPEPNPEPTPNPSVTQTVILNVSGDYVGLDYTAEISDMDEASLEVKLNDELIATRTINSGNLYTETFEKTKIGTYDLFLSGEGVSDSQSITVLDYTSEWDANSIDPDELNFNEDDEVRINITAATDLNFEHNPVLMTASSLDEKTDPRILTGNELVITNNQGETGSYDIKMNYGSGSTNLNGKITNLTDISGQLQDNETDSGRPGFVKAYSLEKELLNEVETNENGNFSLRISDNPVSGYFLQARIFENNDWNGYIRTREFNDGEDKENLVVRTVPYDNLAENEITPEQFKAYMSEIQFGHIRKWDLTGTGETSNPFQGIEIADLNQVTGDYFTLEEQLSIEDTMLANMSCYTGGMLTEENTFVQIDDATSNVNYTNDPDSGIKITNSGWIVVVPIKKQGGGAANSYNAQQIVKGLIVMGGGLNPILRQLVTSHEQGHLFIAPDGHSLSIPRKKTIMHGTINLTNPSEIDCKAGNLIYEGNYTVMDSEFPRYFGEKQERILGLEFGNFD